MLNFTSLNVVHVLHATSDWVRLLEFQNANFEMLSGKLLTSQTSLVAIGDGAAKFVDPWSLVPQ
jgi:hypothetical protein